MSADVFVGLDWATQLHAVCVIDRAGAVLERFEIAHAIRILARAWLRVLWRAWFDRQPYHPELHLGALRALPEGG